MQIKVTRSDGFSWHSEHVGEVFDVFEVKHHIQGNKSYTSFEVDLAGRHHDAIAGTINAKDCQVVDWTDAPQSMEIEGLNAELEALRAQVAELEAIITMIDHRAPRADKTCAQPGITLSEAARRQLRDEGHPLFKEVTPPAPSGTGR